MKIIISSLILILLVGLTGCSTIESIFPVEAPVKGTILYADDFSNPKGWGTLGRSGGSISFDFQGLQIKVDTANSLFWTVNGGAYKDVQIDVDAVLLAGPTDDNFGAICRFKDNKNFYGFIVSHDGYFGMFKSIEGVIYPLLQTDGMQYSEIIRRGGIVNHIQVICKSTTLTMIVNGEELASVDDSDLTKGKFGLIAGAYTTPGVEVLFDNLLVVQP